jgi:hypothetical protein
MRAVRTVRNGDGEFVKCRLRIAKKLVFSAR